MALDQETINKQLVLLVTHRRTLAHLLHQAAQFSLGHLPTHIANGITEARANIAHIKLYLHEHGVLTENEPNDEAPITKVVEQHALSAVLETYIRQMEDLLMYKNLHRSKPDDEVQTVARTRTLVAMRRLDGPHNQNLIQFLRDARLLDIDTSPLVLQRVNLQNTDLREVNLSHINFQEASFQEAELQGADLRGANLKRANFLEADLQGADLRGAHCQQARFTSANLHGADLRKVNLQWVNLNGANLESANLEGANLYGAWLVGTKLQNSNLKDTNLQAATLMFANLQGANLQGANLQGADRLTAQQLARIRIGGLRGATMPDGSIHE